MRFSLGRLGGLTAIQSLPFMSRAHYPRELRAWALLAITLGAVEGEVAGVLVKNLYSGVVDDVPLNLAVATVTGAPAFANVLSVFWSTLAAGRDKVRALVTMQVLCALSLLLVAAAPLNVAGLVLIVSGFVCARVVWSGILTVRSSVWRANYPRRARARVTGRLAVLSSLAMALTGAVIGALSRIEPGAFRWAYPLAAIAGLCGAYAYRRMRVRQHVRLLRAENEERDHGALHGLLAPLRILRQDVPFRRFMTCMTVFGSGNIMFIAPYIIILNEYLGLSLFQQILLTSSVPLFVAVFLVPFWARLLDRVHVLPYRAVHSWSFVSAAVLTCSGAITQQVWLLWIGAICYGAAYAGGMLAWNIGHNDFATPERSAQYMGVHVTLTGLRGLVMPFVGVALYQFVEAHWPGQGAWALLLPTMTTTLGAIGFVVLARATLTGVDEPAYQPRARTAQSASANAPAGSAPSSERMPGKGAGK